MKTFLAWLILAMAPLALGQSYTTITAVGVKVDNGTGGAVAPPAGSNLCFLGVDPTGTAITYVPAGGSPVTGPVCQMLNSSGSLTGALQVANPQTALPAGLRYNITVSNGTTNYITIPMAQISGSAFAFNTYALPVNGFALGVGSPHLACSNGATWTSTTYPSGSDAFTCTLVSGTGQWQTYPKGGSYCPAGMSYQTPQISGKPFCLPPVISGAGIPTGSCTKNSTYFQQDNPGVVYGCFSDTWVLIAGNGGGSSGLTSFQGRTTPAATLQTGDITGILANSPFGLNGSDGILYDSGSGTFSKSAQWSIQSGTLIGTGVVNLSNGTSNTIHLDPSDGSIFFVGGNFAVNTNGVIWGGGPYISSSSQVCQTSGVGCPPGNNPQYQTVQNETTVFTPRPKTFFSSTSGIAVADDPGNSSTDVSLSQIPNSSLANNSITINVTGSATGGGTVALGGSTTIDVTGGGGGGTCPVGATNDVQFNASGICAVDTGKFTYNPTTHSFVAPVNNGLIDTDSFGGVVAAAATTNCVSGNCTLVEPAGSTDGYSNPGIGSYIGYLNKLVRVEDNNNSLFGSYVEDPNATANQFTMVNATRLFQGATDANGGGGITMQINALGTAPGSYDYGRESGDRALYINMLDTTLGINQVFSGISALYGDGDKAFRYWYFNYGGCGHGNGDDESCTAYASQSLETGGSVPVSTVGSYDSTLRWLSLTAVNAEGQIGAGRNAIITTNADGSNASVVTGCNITGSNNAPVNGLPPSVTTDCTLPVSTYIGQATAAILPPRNLSMAAPISITLNTVNGTAPAAGSMACLTSANAHEAVRVVSSSTSGSVVTMTVNVMQNFFLDRAGNGPYLMAGGLCETWGREASGVFNTGNAGVGGMSVVFNIPGVAADGHTLYYSIPETETYQVLSNLYAYSIPQVIAPVNVQLTRVGGVVTVNLIDSSINISSLPLVISGSPSGSFDGSFTSQPGTCGSGGCATWTQAGADVTTPVNATITIGGGNQQLSIYKGALIIDTARPTTDASVGDHNIQLADNDIAWPVGGKIEVPFGTMGAIYEKKNEQLYMPMTTGDFTFSQGTAISGSYFRSSWNNLNPWTMYQNMGGTYTLPGAYHVGGPFGTLFDVSSNGANGAGGLAPQASIFNIQCAFPGRADSQGYLFRLGMNGIGGNIVDDCFNNEIDLNISSANFAWTPGLRIQQTGIQVDGTQYNSSGEIHLGIGAGGKLNPNGTSEHPGLYFKSYSTGNTNSLVGCEMFFISSNQDLCMGNLQSGNDAVFSADGTIELGTFQSNYASQTHDLYVGPHAPAFDGAANATALTTGTNGWQYVFTWVEGISESLPSFPAQVGVTPTVGTAQAASTMNSTNKVIVTCPDIQNGYNAGGHFNIYAEPFYEGVISGLRDNHIVFLGTCVAGGTFSDDNTTPPVGSLIPDQPQGGTVFGGIFEANALGMFGWNPSNQTTAAMDVAFSRISPGVVGLGTGAHGAIDGSLSLSQLTASGPVKSPSFQGTGTGAFMGSNTASPTDLVGEITLSGGTGSRTFSTTMANRPECFIHDHTTPANDSANTFVVTATSLTVTSIGLSDVIGYGCIGRN